MVTSQWAGQSVVKMAAYHSHPSPPIGVSFVDSSVSEYETQNLIAPKCDVVQLFLMMLNEKNDF